MPSTKWFNVSGLFLEVSGILMVLAALIPGGLDAAIGMLFVPALDVTLGAPARLGAGIGGAVLTGWGATMVVLAREMKALGPASVGRAFAVGALTWFVLDGLVSVSLHAYLNLPGNVVYLVAMLLPAWGLTQGGAQDVRILRTGMRDTTS